MFNEKKDNLQNYKIFKEIMEKNDIWYSACAGTAVGAVRDHGFIPWDDDIDVMITYEGFKKLLNMYPDNILNPGDVDYPLLAPKWVPDRAKILTTSVFIDLLIIVKTDLKSVKKYRSLKNKLQFLLFSTGHKDFIPYNKKTKLISFIARLLKPFIKKQLNLGKIIKNLHNPDGDMHILITEPLEKLKFIKITNFTTDVDQYKFEDTTIPLFKAYKENIISRYGGLDIPVMAGKTIIEHVNTFNISLVKYDDMKEVIDKNKLW